MNEISFKVLDISMYDGLNQLWHKIDGLGLRSLDDSREGISVYLTRNPGTSFAAYDGDTIVGSILCGHDGRRGFIYHTCVLPEFRGRGIGTRLTDLALDALRKQGIKKAALVAFASNEAGNAFWKNKDWVLRTDLNYYNLTLDDNNI